MRTVTVVTGSDPTLTDLVKRAVAATGVNATWEEGGEEAVRRSRTALSAGQPGNELKSSLDLFARVVVQKQNEPFLDAVLIMGRIEDADRLAHFAFEYAATHSRQRVAYDGALAPAAQAVARDYPQIRIEALDPEDAANCDVALTSYDEKRLKLPVGPTATACCAPGCALFVADFGPLPTAAMLLEHINEGMAADRIWRALREAEEKGLGADPEAVIGLIKKR